jgi:GntR family transcriptional repressor for pyruvate dehydrogenase complex
MRQPRLAEMVAGALRERIVSGELADGSALPGLDKLVKEFGVSPPSLREALRILENEGLITVRRGNVGGAVVHRPNAEAAAYMLGLVLQGGKVPVSDLTVALGYLEPLCARLCAARSDRRRTVVPVLRQHHKESAAVIEDAVAFEESCQRFHNAIIECCGNQSIVLTVSAYEWLWRQQDEGWAHRVSVLHEYPDIELRRAGYDAHVTLLAAIERGDTAEAEDLARAHLRDPRIRKVSKGAGLVVRATDLLRRQPTTSASSRAARHPGDSR